MPGAGDPDPALRPTSRQRAPVVQPEDSCSPRRRSVAARGRRWWPVAAVAAEPPPSAGLGWEPRAGPALR